LLIQAIITGVQPQIALTPIPVLLAGEHTRTDMEPGASLWASLAAIDQAPGVLHAALFVGFAWVDEARAHAAAVVTGTDPQVIQREADKLALAYWNARHQFGFGTPSGTIDECIAAALAAPEPCVFLSDSGDNVTAGAVGDIPLFVERLLAHKVPSAVVAGLCDAEAVALCQKAGVGATVETTLGGKLGTIHGRPLPVRGKVVIWVLTAMAAPRLCSRWTRVP
jgi:microcystin degradation protein MlrC